MSQPPRKIADALTKPLPKRFYTAATVASRDGMHAVELDGRAAKTPLKRPLAVAQLPLAEAIAAEWSAQVDVIAPATMPLTRLVTTAIDAVADKAADVAAEIVKYAGSDLLCYRAEGPDALVARQAKAWAPVLTWAATALGARFTTTAGLIHVAQPPAATAAMAQAIAHEPPLRLAALHVLTTITGSAVLALAVARQHVTLDQAWAMAHIDEDWQIEQWGRDSEADARRAHRLSDARAAARVLALTADAPPSAR